MVLVGDFTLPGTRYGALNQDYVATLELHDKKALRASQGEQCFVTAVMDGHGVLGEVCARESASAILFRLKHSQLTKRGLKDLSRAELEQIMEEAFTAGHVAGMAVYDNAPQQYIFPIGSSNEHRYFLKTHDSGDMVYYSPAVGMRIVEFGTTATVAVVQGSHMAVANVGDSLAVLGREAGDTYEADIVSVRHYGWEESERQRLQKECGESVSISEDDGYLTVEEGRLRGFQLAMTRALGHKLLSHYGVSHKPSVNVLQLRPEHVCLIVATDGVWETMTPTEAVKEVCDVIAEGGSAADAASQLVRESIRLALTARKPGEADNSTAAVFVFDEI